MNRKILMSITALLLPSVVQAHEGHGHIDAASIWHWLLEFDHIGWLVMVPLAIFVLRRVGRGRYDD